MNQKNDSQNQNRTKGIQWLALMLGLLMPFGLYWALQNGMPLLALLCFVLLSIGFAITALKG